MELIPTLAAADTEVVPQPWKWNPHPEVWVLMASLVLMYLYVTRVIGPKVVPRGKPIITRSQSRWYFVGLVLLWVFVDWPIHDISEDYLYSLHMVQHLVLTWVIPPMFLLATPEWFARLVLGRGRVYRTFRFLTRPLIAGLLYTVVFAVSHMPVVVNDSIRFSGVHFIAHVVVVTSAFLMWNCVCGPLRELRSSLPVQCIYIFLLGVFPIIPGAWLTYSQDVLYSAYIHPWDTFWGFTALGDQQFAGFIMRGVGSLYAGAIIVVLFFKWARENTAGQDDDRRARDRERIARVRAEQSRPTPSGTTGQPTPG